MRFDVVVKRILMIVKEMIELIGEWMVEDVATMVEQLGLHVDVLVAMLMVV